MYERDYEYEYDTHGNMILKIEKDNHYRGEEERRYYFLYKNKYANDKLVEVTGYFNEKVISQNIFFYNESNEITKIERYYKISDEKDFELYRTELIEVNDCVIKRLAYVGDVLAYIDMIEIQNNEAIKGYSLSPVGSNYYWWVVEYDNRCFGIGISEEVLTADILQEMLNYILNIKNKNECMHVQINCSDTIVNFDKKYREVEESFKKKGLDIVYTP